MASFEKLGVANPLTRRVSQGTVDLLQGLTSADAAQLVPYLRIQRLVGTPPRPDPSVPPLNVDMQKPPPFSDMKSNRRYAERPPVSIESFTVATKQNFGTIIEQHVEMKIVVHRPSALEEAFFGDPDSTWRTLLEPGQSHLVTYGWSGGVIKNGLFSGEGFDDERAQGGLLHVPAREDIIFTVYYYTFNLRNNGEIEIAVKGMQNGSHMLRQVQLGDVFENVSSGTTPNKPDRERGNDDSLKSKLQSQLRNVEKIKVGKNMFVRLGDVFDQLLADVIHTNGILWGYDEVRLLAGQLNDRAPISKFNRRRTLEILDLYIPFRPLDTLIGNLTRRGSKITLANFMEAVLRKFVNTTGNWLDDRIDEAKLPADIPIVKVSIRDVSTTQRRVLQVALTDIKKDIVALFGPNSRMKGHVAGSRHRLRERLAAANVPYVSLGHASSFILDANFELVMDEQIKRAKIDDAARTIKDRTSITAETFRAQTQGQTFNWIYSSAIQGNVEMIGNFALGVFTLVWLDFDVSLWSGPFNILEQTHQIVPGEFKTTLTVYDEGTDPLGTRRPNQSPPT